jgi:phosphoribosylformylglycinamidine synthase
VNGATGGRVPTVDTGVAKRTFAAVAAAIRQGLVRSCHDLSEGGLAVAAAEMAFSGDVALWFQLDNVPRDPGLARADSILFSESPSRFLLEVRPADQDRVEKALAGLPFARIGEFYDEPHGRLLEIEYQGRELVTESLRDLKEAWQTPLRW